MKYYVTFGQMYRWKLHPSDPRIHPDGFVVINADCEADARDIAFRSFGQDWAFIYDKEPEQKYFPKGVLFEL
jgi:hypothetical protein